MCVWCESSESVKHGMGETFDLYDPRRMGGRSINVGFHHDSRLEAGSFLYVGGDDE